jgi:uncharacterized RDD family membrane protein YckC
MSEIRATPPAGARRAFITEDALHVHPSLIGLPLAGPWRRGAAFAIDGILVAILANAPGALFGLAAAAVLFRSSARGAASSTYLRQSVRFTLRFAGALVLFLLVVKGWGAVSNRVKTEVIPDLAHDAQATVDGETDSVSVTMTGLEGIRTVGDVVAFRRADDEAEARMRAERFVSALRANGMDESDIRSSISDLAEGTTDKPWLAAAVDSVVKGLDAAAVQGAATETDSAVAPPDSLAVMTARVRDLEREKRALASRLAEANKEEEAPGLVARASTLIEDDLGLGLGWMGLYFTAAVALWQGRTPGKRLLGIRIVRLNGKPIGWWAAFERFGGYAAGVATGLLGFAQIFWDKNRQAIQDKISETAVVRG